MTHEEHSQEAAWQLKMLTASDIAATSNMVRHAVAVALLLCGRRQTERMPAEPEIGACFVPSTAERRFLVKVTAQTRLDQVLTTFDVDDASGPPTGIVLARHEGEAVTFYDTCRLWCSPGSARAALVPTGTQDFGHFVFRRNTAMRHVPGLPAADLNAGFRRADRRLAALLRSDAVRTAGREGWCHVLRDEAGRVTDRATRAAAFARPTGTSHKARGHPLR